MRLDGRALASLLLAAAGLVVYLAFRPMWRGLGDALAIDFIAGAILLALFIDAAMRLGIGRPGPAQVVVRPRHTSRVEPRWDRALAATDDAVRAYIQAGDPEPLARRVAHDPELSGRLQPVLDGAPDPPRPLLHPGWSYAARLVSTAALAWTPAALLASQSPVPAGAAAGLGIMFAGVLLYAAQLNGYGGPWPVRACMGLAGIVLLIVGDLIVSGGRLGLAGAVPYGLGFAMLAVLAGLPFLHALTARRHLPHPALDPSDPEQATRAASRGVRIAIRWAIAFAIIAAAAFLVASLRDVPSGVRSLFRILLAGLPGLAVAVVLPLLIRVLGHRIGARGARDQVQRLRRARADRLLQTIPEVRP